MQKQQQPDQHHDGEDRRHKPGIGDRYSIEQFHVAPTRLDQPGIRTVRQPDPWKIKKPFYFHGVEACQGCDQIGKCERKPEGDENAVFNGPLDASVVHWRQEKPLKKRPHGESNQARTQNTDEGVRAGKPDINDVIDQHAADHVEGAMRKTDYAKDRKDQREAHRHQSINDADDQTIGDLGGDKRSV